MHEQVASEVIILNALLDKCDLHTIGQDFPASTFIPSNLHLELIQRTPHLAFFVTFLFQLLPVRIRPRVFVSSAILHHRLRVPANVAQIPPRAIPMCSTAVFKLVDLWQERLSS